MSSRLAHDGYGQLVAVASVPLPGLDAGFRWLVLGNALEAAGTRIGFLGVVTGRVPAMVERAQRSQRAQRAQAARPGGQRHTWPDDYPQQARDLRAQGCTYQQVADRLGVPFGTVKAWLRTRPDEQLEPEEAIRLARLEQQREPADLIGAAA